MSSRIVSAVLHAAGEVPQHAAIIAGDLRVTYEQLISRAAAVRDHVKRTEAGETIALLCGNAPEFAYAFLGARWAGKRVAVLPTLAPAALLAMMCAEAGAKFALVSEELLAKAKEAGLAAASMESMVSTATAVGLKS